MPQVDHASIGVPFGGEQRAILPGEEQVQELRGGIMRALSLPLPLGMKTRNGFSVLLLLAAVAWFWQPLAALYSLTQAQDHYSHIVLVPWLSLYALYLDRAVVLSSREWSPWLGSLLIGLGAWGYWQVNHAPVTADQLSMTMLTWVVICWGIFTLCYGMGAARKVSFGLLFLLFMVPLPENLLNMIIVVLQRSSAEVTDVVFSFLGVPVFRQGFVFALPNITIQVAEECSGIRSTLSLFITGLVASHFFLRSLWGRVGLVALVFPLAIVKNAFRIVGLSLLANYVDPSFITDSSLHRNGGIPLFLVSLVVLFSVAWFVRRIEKQHGYYPPDSVRAKVAL